jgi:uncharacterized protein (DUF305 family)
LKTLQDEFKLMFQRLTLTLTLLLIAAACSSTGQMHDHDQEQEDGHHHHQPAEQRAEASETRDLKALEELYWSRLQESRMNFTQADVDFMTDMIAHHAQALIMSRLAPENDASRSVQTLAARIINAQDDEIALMQKWLRDRGQPVPIVHIHGLELHIEMEMPEEPMAQGDHDHHGHTQRQDVERHHGHNMHHDMSHHHDMPGMLTQEQLEHLASLRGREFDRYFLKYMIEHHEGAVIMVRDLFKVDGAATDTEAFELSSDIHAEQVTEINRMQQMLDAIDGQ